MTEENEVTYAPKKKTPPEAEPSYRVPAGSPEPSETNESDDSKKLERALGSDSSDSSDSSGVWELFKNIGKPLAEAVSKNPTLSSLLLIAIIFCSVVIIYKSELALILGFALVALIAVFIMAVWYVNHQSNLVAAKIPEKKRREVSKFSYSYLQSLPQPIKTEIVEILDSIQQDASEQLQVPTEKIRVNIFGNDNDILKMLPDFSVNMNRPIEHTIEMPVGYGNTGRAFEEKSPIVTFFDEGWGKSFIHDSELQKSHPNLTWIMSIPLLLKSQTSGTERIPIGVLNIDGIDNLGNENELDNLIKQALLYSQLISKFFANYISEDRGATQ